jgi:hypothetical protein
MFWGEVGAPLLVVGACAIGACGGRIAESDLLDVGVSADAGSRDATAADAGTAVGDATTSHDALAVDGARDARAPGVPDADDESLPSAAPCLAGGSVLALEGAPGSFWYDGSYASAPSDGWLTQAKAGYAFYDGALLEITRSGSGVAWVFFFNTWKTKEAMQTGVVYDAALVDASGQMVSYARTCTVTLGTFRVDEFSATGGVIDEQPGTLVAFTAAFSLSCFGTTARLRGCVHYER